MSEDFIINPIEYGKLISTVHALEKKIDSMDEDLKELLALANKSRGGFWAGMMIASLLGAIISYLTNVLIK